MKTCMRGESVGYLSFPAMVISVARINFVLISVSQLAVRVLPGYVVVSVRVHWATLKI
jgi:hypothetical protein